MVLGRPKGFKVSTKTLDKMRKARVAYWASDEGRAQAEKLSAGMRARWAEQKAKLEVK